MIVNGGIGELHQDVLYSIVQAKDPCSIAL